MRPGSIIMSQRIKLKITSGLGRGLETKEVQNATLCWQGDGNCILGCTRRYYVGLSSKKSTITGAYYANLLNQLRTAIREKCWGKLSKGILLQQDNARVHTCKTAMDAVEWNGYELIPQPAYSPDLAPSDYFLFPNLKKDIRGRHFQSNEEVVVAVEEWVRDKDPGFFWADGTGWSKCIILEGNYIEKEEIDLTQKC